MKLLKNMNTMKVANLIKSSKVVELDLFTLQADGKDEALGVKGHHRPTWALHEAHAVRRPQVPHTHLQQATC
jgi:hypothetical protein